MFYDVFVMGTRSVSHVNINGYCMVFRKAVVITLACWWRG